jgi:hypothetical protein
MTVTGARATLSAAQATPSATIATPRPSPSETTLQAPPAGPLFTAAAIVAVALALAAAVIGYRIIRGGRGL